MNKLIGTSNGRKRNVRNLNARRLIATARGLLRNLTKSARVQRCGQYDYKYGDGKPVG